ncbi:MAG: hypothetical protein Ct9H300mP13_2680 [Gammaproteobacteria bacterium]|nr:MAG: hypothetical protein Ct9H300mP13_2680 [Gammaproteobacteria bacterium]
MRGQYQNGTPGGVTNTSLMEPSVITNAPEASFFTVFARTAPKADGVKGFPRCWSKVISWHHKRSLGSKNGATRCHTGSHVYRLPSQADAFISGTEGVGFKTAMKVLIVGVFILGRCGGNGRTPD